MLSRGRRHRRNLKKDGHSGIRYLVDAQSKAQGVFLEEEMWQRVCSHVLAELEKLFPSETGPAEPLADLALLEKYWDFRYDLPTDVACDICGASSPDWQADEPRKFILRAANMGGLPYKSTRLFERPHHYLTHGTAGTYRGSCRPTLRTDPSPLPHSPWKAH